MKILVTGGAGFIGSSIVDAYVKLGHQVTIIDNFSTGLIDNVNPAAKLFEMDINDEAVFNIFEEEQFDIVSHHAAQLDVRVSVDDPRFDATVNILGGLNIYEAALKNKVKKIIFASSGGTVYGDSETLPSTEEDVPVPISPYGIAKFVNEKYLHYYDYVHGLKSCIFRYTNVYGPRQNPHGEAGVVAIFAQKMLSGGRPIIHGDGLNTRDYVYIDDVVRANVLALKESAYGIYNVSTSVEKDVNFIFNVLNKLTRANLLEYHGPGKQGEQKRVNCSYEKLNKEHGWKPEIDINDGLARTVEYFKRRTI